MEEACGLPVIAVQQENLEDLTTLQLATPEDQTHRILYRHVGEASSYQIDFEDALLQSFVQVPAEQRVILHGPLPLVRVADALMAGTKVLDRRGQF